MSSNSLTKGSLTLTAAALRTGRYTLAAQALHWITAVLMFTLLPLAWVMVSMPRTAANRELIYTLHKSLGLTVLALVAVRLILRAIHPAPQLHLSPQPQIHLPPRRQPQRIPTHRWQVRRAP